jgi:hypothetical protein
MSNRLLGSTNASLSSTSSASGKDPDSPRTIYLEAKSMNEWHVGTTPRSPAYNINFNEVMTSISGTVEKKLERMKEEEKTESVQIVRQRAFSELIETEKTYCKRLENLEFHYRRRLLSIIDAIPEEIIIPQNDIDAIFLNLEELLRVSQLMLKEFKRNQLQIRFPF